MSEISQHHWTPPPDSDTYRYGRWFAEMQRKVNRRRSEDIEALAQRTRQRGGLIYPWWSGEALGIPAPAIIVDVDGTLVDVSGIRHHVDPSNDGKRDFHAFHRDSIDCPPVAWVVDLVREYDRKGYPIVIVTGRSRKYERLTAMWLALHQVPSTEMYMRGRGDQRPDVEVKREILHGLRHRYRIGRAIDDNPAIIDLWRSEDIPVTTVPGWDDAPAPVSA